MRAAWLYRVQVVIGRAARSEPKLSSRVTLKLRHLEGAGIPASSIALQALVRV